MKMLALLATSTVGTTIQADGFRYTLIKEQSECNSNDLWLGKRSLKSCAEEITPMQGQAAEPANAIWVPEPVEQPLSMAALPAGRSGVDPNAMDD